MKAWKIWPTKRISWNGWARRLCTTSIYSLTEVRIWSWWFFWDWRNLSSSSSCSWSLSMVFWHLCLLWRYAELYATLCPVIPWFWEEKRIEGIIGTICPCFLFGKNAEFLGSGTLAGSCMTHFILWGLVNSLCCLFSGGILAFFPGAMVACYACGYRKALRTKHKLQEAPCGDLTTHLFCHPCAICQEYREIRERSNDSTPSLIWTDMTAPPIQTMHPPEKWSVIVVCRLPLLNAL